MEEIMGIEGIYAMMKQIREEMYADGKQTVTLGQAEFFALYGANGGIYHESVNLEEGNSPQTYFKQLAQFYRSVNQR